MKIALFLYLNTYKLGGAERRLVRIFSSLSDRGFDSEIIVLHRSNEKDRLVSELQSFSNSKVKIKVFKNLYEVYLNMYHIRYKWVCSISPTFRNALVFIFAYLLKTKRLFASVSMFSSSLNFIDKKEKIRFMTIVKISDIVDCLYPSYTSQLQTKFPNQLITTTPGAFTDLSLFYPAEKKEKLIVFAARMYKFKSPELMAKAITICQDEIRKFGYRFILCGSGPESNKIKNLLKDNNCMDICEIHDYINMSTILPKAQIFCSLQTITNYPSQSLIEALASGCYCIATNCGDTELLVKPEFGRLISFKVSELAEAIIEAIQIDDISRKEIEVASRFHIEEKYTLEKSLIHYERLFQKGEIDE